MDLMRKLVELARKEIVILLALLLVTGGIWLFIEIADEVMEGDTHTWDERIILSLRQPGNIAEPLGPHWLKTGGMDITALGGTAVLIIVLLATVSYLAMLRKYHAMWLVIAAAGGGQILSAILKSSFSRQRPSVVPHLTEVQTSSFPSGHSLMSAVVYLTLGALLAQLVKERRARIFFISISLFLTFMVGLSRIYLGVHYPSDVLAGWSIGLSWAILCWTAARYLQRRGAIEKPAKILPEES